MGVKAQIIEEARAFAINAHHGQKDDAGKDFFKAHVVQVAHVAQIVTEDPDIVAAAYLHDTVEDCGVQLTEIADKFGPRVARLVWEVTCVILPDGSKIFPYLHSREAMMLKFCDRLSNLSRMTAWDLNRQRRYQNKSIFWRSK